MKDPWLYIKGFQPVSLCDWPGKVSCVIFLGGCNLRCPTCHNKSLVFYYEKLPTIPKEEIISYLKNRKEWIDGIVISGGEPTLVDLKRLILDLKKEVDLPIKIDTNGLRPEVVEELLRESLIELVAVDIKGPWEKYPKLTGGRCDPDTAKRKISKLIDLAKACPSKFYFRITKVPLIEEKDIEVVKSYLSEGQRLNVQEYIEPKDTFMEEDHVY